VVRASSAEVAPGWRMSTSALAPTLKVAKFTSACGVVCSTLSVLPFCMNETLPPVTFQPVGSAPGATWAHSGRGMAAAANTAAASETKRKRGKRRRGRMGSACS
jgi:hypothetical protein